MSAYKLIVDLINKGPKIKCSRTARYDHLINMNADGKGGYVIKTQDIFAKPNTRSKYLKGPGWWRGFR